LSAIGLRSGGAVKSIYNMDTYDINDGKIERGAPVGAMPARESIAALATPMGTSAIAVIRLSGAATRLIVRGLTGGELLPRVAHHRDYRGCGGVLFDDVVMTFYPGPKSYTGEDTLEISAHGNPFIAQKILEDLVARGARLAEPGEFTQRAFLAGKLDLSRAEAVMDLIRARSDRALAVANRQLRGGLTDKMNGLIEELLKVLARIEVYIDFPEEDLPDEDRRATSEIISRILLLNNRLLATERFGSLLRDGVKAVIIGAPNAGKSSLLNRLVGKDRALVSAEPGTTRDFIEERILVGAHALRLIDTAGLNPSPTPLERLGIQKTWERASEADLFLVMVDASAVNSPTLPWPQIMAERLTTANTIVVLNKMDLVAEKVVCPVPAGFEVVKISVVTGMGQEALLAAIAAKADAFNQEPEDLVAINTRHAVALSAARDLLVDAARKFGESGPMELVASDLRGVLAAFGEISGRVDNERVLDHLFATFCIGK
jgi:tRNA modification GTPase